MAKTGTIVIDPGHGGQLEVGGSSANNARSPSGVLEKNMTLRMAFLVRQELQGLESDEGHKLNIILTRETDVNLGLDKRANVARDNNADLFLCIHFNASDNHRARGVETLVRPAASGNTNHSADTVFSQQIQIAVYNAILGHDAKTRDRGVKDQLLGVLKRSQLGPTVRAAYLEVEFIDVAEVDTLLNISPSAPQVRQDIAKAIARNLVDAL